MLKDILISVVGGMVGAAILIGAVGGISMYAQGKYSVHLPLLVSAVSAGKSQIILFGELLAKKNASQACLIIDSFKVGVPSTDLFNSVTALFPLPSSCLPVSQPADVPVKLFDTDGKSTIDGTVHMGLDGSVTISSTAPTVAGGAWGLASPVEIAFDIVKK